MTTLSNALPATGSSAAIVIPCKPRASVFSFDNLGIHVSGFQQKLAHLGIAPHNAVSIALPNSYEFAVAFLATARQRAIAAPLNPAYEYDEFEFYIDDLKSSVILVPEGSYRRNDPAVRAARKYKAAIAECFWDGREVAMEVKHLGDMAHARIQHLCTADTSQPHYNNEYIQHLEPDMELEEAFNAPVLEAYAMTEAAHQMTSNPLPPAKRLPGSVGIGSMGVEVRILDIQGTEVPQGSEAEICIRGKNVTNGYLNNPDANKSSFTAKGFFRTGDQGKQDENGYVIITGRIKELINKGGEKISPVEVDNVVAQHPAVAEAVCFAIPDKVYGQDVGLAVVLREGANLTEDALRQWITTKVAKFKVAKLIYFTKIMPKTATGKVQRRMVADAMAKNQELKARL
ncbi:MAG: hypothetical protein Q9184_004347 [Pyrenodesmia sp. 2 TL-2023]